jgi:GTP-binding protein HflX
VPNEDFEARGIMRAVVVECKLPSLPSRADEAKSMAENIGYDVVDVVVQRRESDHHSYFIGPGKVEELKEIVDANEVETVIFTNTLPSSQVFKLQQRLGGEVRVIDRNLLILEVFDKRAMTKEAKLQIKLAKLKYTLSWGREFIKLRGIMGEQVGWMGPGDYPFQEYYRAARSRISRLEAELRDLNRKKEITRARRRELGFPMIALAGYTQAGKTTLFNRLASETKRVGLGPFTTLSTFARKVRIGASRGSEFIMIDSIGLIEDMHPTIVKAFTATLGEIAHSDVILLFVDASEEIPVIARQCSSMDKILREIEADAQIIVCANKIDLVQEQKLESAIDVIRERFIGTTIVPISALKGENLDKLFEAVSARINDMKLSAGPRPQLSLNEVTTRSGFTEQSRPAPSLERHVTAGEDA